jgi:DNA-binding XRE family transcriptional regulator
VRTQWESHKSSPHHPAKSWLCCRAVITRTSSILAARRAEAALAAGREELLSAEDAAALLAAPTPLAFWRKNRGKTQAQLAAEIGVSQNFLSDLERGKLKGDVTLYGKLARCLELLIDDLAPESD